MAESTSGAAEPGPSGEQLDELGADHPVADEGLDGVIRVPGPRGHAEPEAKNLSRRMTGVWIHGVARVGWQAQQG